MIGFQCEDDEKDDDDEAEDDDQVAVNSEWQVGRPDRVQPLCKHRKPHTLLVAIFMMMIMMTCRW